MADQLDLAISVHAPWAWTLMHGRKDVENRSPGFPQRRNGRTVLGRVWVHASLWPGPTKVHWCPDMAPSMLNAWRLECAAALRRAGWLAGAHEQAMFSMRGHIVGSIEVYGYRQPDDPPDSPWYIPGSLAIMVRDPRPLVVPVPAKGALGWWTPPSGVIERLKESERQGPHRAVVEGL